MKRCIDKAKQKGASMIEVMITVVVIAVSVAALIRFQSYLSYDSALVKQRSDATVIAQQQLENLMDFQTLTVTAGYASYAEIASGTSSTTLSGTAYSVAWTVSSFTFPTYKTINVNVSWVDRYGTSQTISMASDVAGIEPAFSAIIY